MIIKGVDLRQLLAFLERLSKREKILFYCAAFLVSLILFDHLLISPIFSKIRALQREIQERESAIKKNLHIVAHKDRILAEVAKYSSFFSTTSLADEEELTSLLKELETLANKSSVYLIDMKPGSFKEAGLPRRCLVNLNCEAQMEQLIDFIYAIESSSKILVIEKYQISPKSGESSVARCSMVISRLLIP